MNLNPLNSKLSIAPMIDWTYMHFRMFMRILAPQALLYTEMQTTGAIEHNPMKSLAYHALEHPIALQLGGSDPKALAQSALIAEEAGYDEVNLNLGCPSDKVQAGYFGACLMKEPDRVSDCLKAMKQAVTIPVTAKIRIGVDEQDSYECFRSFAYKLIDAGCDKLIIHARKAWLQGLSPKQNRTIPPVNYEYVYRLKQELAEIPMVINGNILTSSEVKSHLNWVDGVMLGRLACDNPYQIAVIAQELYPNNPLLSREQVLKLYKDYLREEYAKGAALSVLIKPLFNLFHGLPGARKWKQHLMLLLKTKDMALLEE